MICTPTQRSSEETNKPNVARHHDGGFIESIKHHEGYRQEPGESVINVKDSGPNTGGDEEKTLCVSPEDFLVLTSSRTS